MHSKPISEAELSETGSELAVMHFLLMDQPVWSQAELATALGDRIDAEDAVSRLAASGLVNRWGDFCCASRAAHHQYALDQA